MAKLPFPPYEGSADAAANAGGKATDQKATFNALESNLSGQSDKASQEASGLIKPSVSKATTGPEADSGSAAAAALVGGASINHFANAIRTYNGHVEDLNDRWEREKANDFGVGATEGHEEGKSDAENDSARQGLVSAARGRLERELERLRKGHEDTLDNAADFAASMLIAGPTRSTLLALYITGDIDVKAAAEALGMTVGVLNNIRIATASLKGIHGWKDTLPALTNYLLKKDPKKLAEGTMDLVKRDLRRLVRKNMKPGTTMTFAQRIQAYKTARPVSIRGQNLVKNATPGNLFGKFGANTKYFGTFSKIAGRALSPLAVVAGVHSGIETLQNWKGSFDDYNNLVGSAATVTSGALGTGMMIAAAAGMTFPPLGAAIAVGAGVVALGSLAVSYREEIWAGMKWTGGKIAEGAELAWEGTKFVGEKAWEGTKWVGEQASEAWDAGTEWAGDRLDDAKDLAADVGSDIAEGASDVVEGAGDVIEDITPW